MLSDHDLQELEYEKRHSRRISWRKWHLLVQWAPRGKRYLQIVFQGKYAVATRRWGYRACSALRAPIRVRFYTLSSQKFEKTEQELMAYESPVARVIEDNSIEDVQEVGDEEFLFCVEEVTS